jgi:hypothetical protein
VTFPIIRISRLGAGAGTGGTKIVCSEITPLAPTVESEPPVCAELVGSDKGALSLLISAVPVPLELEDTLVECTTPPNSLDDPIPTPPPPPFGNPPELLPDDISTETICSDECCKTEDDDDVEEESE